MAFFAGIGAVRARRRTIALLTPFAALLLTSSLCAQETPRPRRSQQASVTQALGPTRQFAAALVSGVSSWSVGGGTASVSTGIGSCGDGSRAQRRSLRRGRGERMRPRATGRYHLRSTGSARVVGGLGSRAPVSSRGPNNSFKPTPQSRRGLTQALGGYSESFAFGIGCFDERYVLVPTRNLS